MKGLFVLTPADPAYPRVRRHFLDTLGSELAQGPREVTIKEPTRTSDQNAKMWAMLGDVSKQVQWAVNGKLRTLEPEEWKDVMTAALKGEQRVAQGINGGFVLLGIRTSKMGKRAMSDLIELIYAFGAEHDVKWSEPPEEDER